MALNNKLVNRCAETITSSGIAGVNAALSLSAKLTDPYTSNTFASAYGTSAGDVIKSIPVHLYQADKWQSGLASYTHSGNSIAFTTIEDSSSGGAAISVTAGAIITVAPTAGMGVMTVEHIKPTGVNDQDLINEASRDLIASNTGGKIILTDGEYDIRSTIEMWPKIWIIGNGMHATRFTVNQSVGAFDVFSFDSVAQGYGANQQGWGLDKVMIRAYSANTDVRGIRSKVSNHAMQDVRLYEVNFDGFSDSRSSSNAVMDIGDPWGFRLLNCITEQTGNRPVLQVTANGISNNGAMIAFNKLKRDDGDIIKLTNCNRCTITHNELYSNTAGKYNIILDNSNLNTVDHNAVEFGDGSGIHITNDSDGNILTGNTMQNSGTAANGILIDSGCDGNIVNGGMIVGFTSNYTNNSTGSRASMLWDGVNYIYDPSPFITEAGENSTTGDTEKDFVLPSGVKEITITFKDLSTNGTEYPRIVIGDSGGFETSGYTGSTSIITTGPIIIMHAASEAWPLYDASNWLGGNIMSGALTLTRESPTNNTWVISGVLNAKSDVSVMVGGAKSLTTELTQLRLTMDGVDQFDSGAINVSYKF